MTLYADFFVAELPVARRYPCEVDFADEDKATFTSVTPIDLARLVAVITNNTNQLFGLAELLTLSEDDNRAGEVLTPLPPWFTNAVSGLSDTSLAYHASQWAKVEDISLDATTCQNILSAVRRLAGRVKFGKRLFLWNSTLSAKFLRKRHSHDDLETDTNSRVKQHTSSRTIEPSLPGTDSAQQSAIAETESKESGKTSIDANTFIRAQHYEQSEPTPPPPETPLASLLSNRRNPMDEPLTEAELIALVKRLRLNTVSVQPPTDAVQNTSSTQINTQKFEPSREAAVSQQAKETKSISERIKSIIYSNLKAEEILEELKPYVALGNTLDDVKRRNRLKFVRNPSFRRPTLQQELISEETGLWISIDEKFGVTNIVRQAAVIGGVSYHDLKLGEKPLPSYYPFESEAARQKDAELLHDGMQKAMRKIDREKKPFFKRLWHKLTGKE